MNLRWSHLDRDEATLRDLRSVSANELRWNAESVVRSGANSWHLYKKWEHQHWQVDSLRIGDDRTQWESFSNGSREMLLDLFASFYVGECTAVDGLTAVTRGAPQEDYLVFLATQSADEARHVAFMNEIDKNLMDGNGSLRDRLPEFWECLTPPYKALQRVEDQFVTELLERPDIDSWLRVVTVFHLLTEGVLAINGQQSIIRALRLQGDLPEVEKGFIGMMRDESRHIAFGTQAVREWVSRGFERHVIEAMEMAVPHVVHVGDRGESNLPAVHHLTNLVDRRLAAAGVSLAGRKHVAIVAAREYDSKM